MAVIFHVGPPKTGTSSFQTELWRSSNLGTLNAFYPIDIDLNELAKVVFDRNELALDHLSAIYEKHLSSKHEHLILSAEGFSDLGYIDFDLYNQSCNFFCNLNNLFVNEEVILLYTLTENDYFRMESQVIEAIKHGLSFEKQSIFEYIRSVPYFSSQRLFENVSRIIRPNRTIILRLNSFDAIFNATASLFGLLGFQELSAIPIVNKSPSPSALYLQHAINKHLSTVTANFTENQLRDIDKKLIDFISQLNDLESNNSEMLNFLGISSRDKLFSIIDSNFLDERASLVEYIEKFRRDTYFYSETLLKPQYRGLHVDKSLQGILEIFKFTNGNK